MRAATSGPPAITVANALAVASWSIGIHQPRGIPDHLGKRGAVGAHERSAAREGFERRQPESLVTREIHRAGRQGVERRKIRIGHEADVTDRSGTGLEATASASACVLPSRRAANTRCMSPRSPSVSAPNARTSRSTFLRGLMMPTNSKKPRRQSDSVVRTSARTTSSRTGAKSRVDAVWNHRDPVLRQIEAREDLTASELRAGDDGVRTRNAPRKHPAPIGRRRARRPPPVCSRGNQIVHGRGRTDAARRAIPAKIGVCTTSTPARARATASTFGLAAGTLNRNRGSVATRRISISARDHARPVRRAR